MSNGITPGTIFFFCQRFVESTEASRMLVREWRDRLSVCVSVCKEGNGQGRNRDLCLAWNQIWTSWLMRGSYSLLPVCFSSALFLYHALLLAAHRRSVTSHPLGRLPMKRQHFLLRWIPILYSPPSSSLDSYSSSSLHLLSVYCQPSLSLFLCLTPFLCACTHRNV